MSSTASRIVGCRRAMMRTNERYPKIRFLRTIKLRTSFLVPTIINQSTDIGGRSFDFCFHNVSLEAGGVNHDHVHSLSSPSLAPTIGVGGVLRLLRGRAWCS
jgi:hypothetical protein